MSRSAPVQQRPAQPGPLAATDGDFGPILSCQLCGSMLRDKVFATQFHPEKSGRNGLQMLVNFVNWDGDV